MKNLNAKLEELINAIGEGGFIYCEDKEGSKIRIIRLFGDQWRLTVDKFTVDGNTARNNKLSKADVIGILKVTEIVKISDHSADEIKSQPKEKQEPFQVITPELAEKIIDEVDAWNPQYLGVTSPTYRLGESGTMAFIEEIEKDGERYTVADRAYSKSNFIDALCSGVIMLSPPTIVLAKDKDFLLERSDYFVGKTDDAYAALVELEKPVPFDGPEIPAGGPVDSAYILEHCSDLGISGIEAWCESAGVTLTWTTLYDEWKEMWINDGFDFNNPDDVEIIDDMPDYKKLDDRDYMFDYLKVENCNPQIVDGHVIFGHSDGSEGLFVYEDISFEESLEKRQR